MRRIWEDYGEAFVRPGGVPAGFDIVVTSFLAIGLIIRSDGGPAFFRQVRVGKAGRFFRIFKFRTMVVDAEKLGTQVTSEHDPRITRIGRILRKTKLDELPQLLNVFVGDMSLVGPRPEVPYYVARWPEEDRKVILSVKPGITDYATLFYNDEQAVLAKTDDPKEAYMKKVMPHKLEMYMRYVGDQNFCLDLRLILATLRKMAGLNVKILNVLRFRC